MNEPILTCYLCNKTAQGRCPMCWRPLCDDSKCFMPHMKKEYQTRLQEREEAIRKGNIPNTQEARDLARHYKGE